MIYRYRGFFIIYCIGGAFAALALILQSLGEVARMIISIVIENKFENYSFFFFFVYSLFISIYGIFCGLKIANNSPQSRKYVTYYLIPQIPFITISGFTYFMKLGLDFTIYTIFNPAFDQLMELRLNPSIGAYFNINFNLMNNDQLPVLGINFIPVILLLFLYKINKSAE